MFIVDVFETTNYQLYQQQQQQTMFNKLTMDNLNHFFFNLVQITPSNNLHLTVNFRCKYHTKTSSFIIV